MSKAKLIELIKMDRRDLMVKLNEISRFGEDVIEFQNILRQALKDQDRDTRHGCAERIDGMIAWIWEANALIYQYQASSFCTNYKDKDLEGL